MGIFYEELWQCKSCGFEFSAMSGLYEADPNDFGTTHSIDPYYCPNCHSVENVAYCVSLDKPQEGNEHLILHDKDICEHCGTKMERLEKVKYKFFKRKYICPECGKKQFRFIEESECWT